MAGLMVVITANRPRRCRAGLIFTDKGRVIDLDALNEAHQEAIKTDPALHIRDATDDDLAASPATLSDDERDALIVEAIKTLDATDFDGGGKPRVPALREALDKPEIELTAALRDTVFKGMLEEGFQKPTTD